MRTLLIVTLLISVTLVGCNSNPLGRFTVSGAVTLDGEPIAEGTISFEPVGEQAVKVRSGALIKEGKYTMPAASGLTAGEYLVSISSQQKTGKIEKTPIGDIEETVDVIPPEYGSASTQRINVTGSKTQTFDFNIKTKQQ